MKNNKYVYDSISLNSLSNEARWQEEELKIQFQLRKSFMEEFESLQYESDNEETRAKIRLKTKEILQKNPDYIRVIEQPDDELIKIALKEKPFLISYIEKPSFDVIQYLFEKTHNSVFFVINSIVEEDLDRYSDELILELYKEGYPFPDSFKSNIKYKKALVECNL